MIQSREQTLFRRRLTSAITLPIVLLLLLSGVSIWQITRLLSALRWVDHTDQVISHANYTQKLLLDRETGLRGYLLTGKQNFLAPYEQANAVIDVKVEDLKRLVADNPDQVRQVTTLIAQSNQWEQLAPASITRRQRGEREPLSELELRKQLMDTMRQQVDSFIATEEQLRSERSQTAQQTTTTVILTSLLLALSVGAVLAYFLRRQILQVSQIYEGALCTAQVKTQEAQRAAVALQQYKDIFEFAEYGLVVGTADNQTLALINPAFAQMHGYTVEELLGTPILNLFPSQCHAEAIEFITRVNERGYNTCESWHCRKDGTVFPVFLSGTAVRDVKGNLLYRIVSVYDITQNKQAQIALQRSAQRLATLHKIDQAILASEKDETLIDNALARLRQIVPHQQAFVAVFDLETSMAQVLAGSSQTGKLSHSTGTQLTVADFAPLQSLLHGIRYVENFATEEACPPVLLQLRSHGFSSCVCVPLLVENTLVGELNLASTEPSAFNEESIEVAHEVAQQLAVALRQSRLRRQLQATNKELQHELTQRQQAEIELREQEQLFRSTFNQAAVGIAHVSLTGQWLRVNQKLCEIVGYTREELLQRTFQDITYAEDLDIDLFYVRQMLAYEIQTYSMEKRYIRKDNSLVWINLTVSLVREATGQPKYFISVVEDISQRKEAEEALRQSEVRFRSALFNAPLPIVLHTENGEVLQVNHVWTELTGYSIQEIPTIGDWLQRAYGERSYQVRDDIARVLPLRRPTSMGEYTITTAQGTTRIWDIYASPLGQVADNSLMVVMAIDVTQRKQAEQEILNLNQELQQLNTTLEQRVALRTAQLQETNTELEAFTYSVSHDLRAPLRTIQGFSQALLEDCGGQLEEFCRSYINSIIDDAAQMNKLISDLLAYSRLTRTQINIQPIALDEVVKEAFKQLTAEIQENVAQIRVVTPLPQVMAHRSTLVQVVVNLISNAIKFVEPNIQPSIDIFASTERQDNQDWVKLWITDNGIGIAPEHQERIFRILERLHGAESYPGTGIGLAIVRKGLDRMGGLVGMESQLGHGSRFWIALPSAVV
ncbi:MAG: PAS domain S-box protein [Calothrix sp. FI2-JRJ7]|jgi:PAS domain S-box-containing protein|nr:PAS domain S-box protein [Calothrix sp. FI2-JRJ7]